MVLGCGHSGVINTLEHVRALAGFGIDYLAPNHCTGLAATCLLRRNFPDQFHESPTGTVHRFGAAA